MNLRRTLQAGAARRASAPERPALAATGDAALVHLLRAATGRSYARQAASRQRPASRHPCDAASVLPAAHACPQWLLHQRPRCASTTSGLKMLPLQRCHLRIVNTLGAAPRGLDRDLAVALVAVEARAALLDDVVLYQRLHHLCSAAGGRGRRQQPGWLDPAEALACRDASGVGCRRVRERAGRGWV